MNKLMFSIGGFSAVFGALLLSLLYLYVEDPNVAGMIAFFPFIGGLALMLNSRTQQDTEK